MEMTLKTANNLPNASNDGMCPNLKLSDKQTNESPPLTATIYNQSLTINIELDGVESAQFIK